MLSDNHAQNTSSATPPNSVPEPPASNFLGRHPFLRRTSLIMADLVVLTAAFALAYEVAFVIYKIGPAPLPDTWIKLYHRQFLYVAPFLVILRLLLLNAFGLYRGFARYTSVNELLNIILACGAGTAALIIFNKVSVFIPQLGGFPIHNNHILRLNWGIVAIDGLLSIMGVGGVHLIRRLIAERLNAGQPRESERVLIIGAGNAGEQVARDLIRNHREQFRPVVFADPDPLLKGRRIHGLPVAGTLDNLEEITAKHDIQRVVIALPNPTPGLLRQLVDHCQRARLRFQIIPDLDAVMRGQVQFSRLRPVEIEDLLGRPPVVLPVNLEHSIVRGRRVLVTGAGGSIGSELCRQVLQQKPAMLVLLSRGENSLYEIEQELAPKAGELGVALEAIVGDIRDRSMIFPLMQRIRPQVVLHAAAHKHVHLMETQPAEAIKNNVTGTRVVAEAAIETGVERFILISTDKAVHPIGIMGASKRIAEMMVSALNGLGRTRFISVRFGNVLGSRGSVIPLFRRQIAAGGPLTVTDPRMTRYFMTIPEAVSLVLEAGAQGTGGEVFLLDMGQPVRIVDLARNLITLSGLEPDRDIEIKFTGLRPGEKLFEELFTNAEEYDRTTHTKILSCRQTPQTPWIWTDLAPMIDRLSELAWRGDDQGIRALLAELISDYAQKEAPPAEKPEAARREVS